MKLFCITELINEAVFLTSRSSGPGGQNVNKVNSRIELRFSITNSEVLSDEQKQLLSEKLASKLTSDGLLIVTCQENRSQLRNKEIAIEKFYHLITKALTPVKKRRSTKPTISSIEKRLRQKKENAEKKQLRGKSDF